MGDERAPQRRGRGKRASSVAAQWPAAPGRTRRRGPAVMLAAALLACRPAGAQTGAPPSVVLPPFQSAEACRGCHAREVAEWSESWMSRAWTARNFQHDQQALAGVERADPNVSPRPCRRCHAPLSMVLRDHELRLPQSREGVTCDFCHSVATVPQGGGAGKLGIDPRGVRYGAGTPSEGAPHPVGTSEALRDARLCAMCHSDFDAAGIALERTYREWLEGPYAAQGIGCVSCHMAPLREGDGPVSHRFPGGHSDSPLLPGAAVVTVHAVTTDAVELTVSNVRVGHNFPSAGAHPNALHLVVTLLDDRGRVLAEHRRRFAFTYLDADGREVEGGATVARVEDTTLAPRESRRVHIPLPRGARVIEARLVYVPMPEHMVGRVGKELYAAFYAPVEVHRLRQPL